MVDEHKKQLKKRLLALDVFRGMTIFFMITVNTPGSWNYVYAPLRHAKWDGCTPTDLVFPFFVFIVGVSMFYSFKSFNLENRSQWLGKILKRTALIFFIGLLLNFFPFFNKSLADLRIFGVLQRIALAYGGAGLLILLFNRKYVVPIIAALLVGYYGILVLFGGEGALTLEGNLVRKIDLWLVGENHLYGGYGLPFDPEGLLSAIPAIGTALLGYWTGSVLHQEQSLESRIQKLVIVGLGLIAVSVALHYTIVPINKPIWSSSYVLFTAGLGMCFLSLLLFLLDIQEWKSWVKPFKVFGLNPLISYVLSGLFVKTMFLIKIGEENLYSWTFANVHQKVFGDYFGSLMFALTMVALVYIFALWLYKNDKVIKV